MKPGHIKTTIDLPERVYYELKCASELTGKKMSDIADLMHLSPKTVATYKYRIFEKLDTRNDVDMTRMAMRYGVVAPG